MPIQEREHWDDDYFEHLDEKRDAWITIPFVRLCRDDRRAAKRQCRKLCGAGLGQFLSP